MKTAPKPFAWWLDPPREPSVVHRLAIPRIETRTDLVSMALLVIAFLGFAFLLGMGWQAERSRDLVIGLEVELSDQATENLNLEVRVEEARRRLQSAGISAEGI